MPGFLAHLLIANKILDEQNIDSRLSCTNNRKEFVAALRLGSVAPDFGMYPGGSKLFSDCAHYVRTGELCELLISTAHGSDIGSAFATGWLSHYFADVRIHPLINQEVGMRARKQPLSAMLYYDNPGLHVAVELGLDAVLSNQRKQFVFPSKDSVDIIIGLIDKAYQQVYGLKIRESIEKSISAFNRWSVLQLKLAVFHSRILGDSKHHTHLYAKLRRSLFNACVSPLPTRSVFRGMMAPFYPSQNLLEAFNDESANVAKECSQKQLPSLLNLNLDSGLSDQDTYPPAISTRASLMHLAPNRGPF